MYLIYLWFVGYRFICWLSIVGCRLLVVDCWLSFVGLSFVGLSFVGLSFVGICFTCRVDVLCGFVVFVSP
jgi:hypothetical protein